MTSGPPTSPEGGGGHSWQIAAPTGAPVTSIQMSSGGGSGRGGGQPQQQQQQHHQQQHLQQQQQQQQPIQPGQHQTMPPLAYHPQQGGRGGGRGVPHPQQGGRGANGPHAYVVGMPPPMGYFNPYAQHPQYTPQVPGGRGGAHGWNPTYPGAPVPVGGNPYAQPAGPQQYYPQQGGTGRGGGSIAGRGVPRGGNQGGAGRGNSSYTPPAPRVKKVSVITDKDGNPIDFSSSSKKSSLATAATATSSTAVAVTKTESSSSNAGAKLRQAALDAIQGKADKESVKRKAEEEAAAIAAEKKAKEEVEAAAAAAAKEKEEEEQAAAKKKAEEEQAAAEKKREEEEEAAAKVKAADDEKKEEERKNEEKKNEEKKKEEAATAIIKPKSKLASLLSKQGDKQESAKSSIEDDTKPKSTLASLLSKQEVKEESPEKSAEEDTVAPCSSTASPASINATATTSSTNGKSRRHVYSKEELQRLRSLPVCQVRPTDLPEFVIAKGASAVRGGPGGGGGSGRDGHNRGGGGDRRQPRGGGGGGGSWERGAAPPQRRDSQPNNQNQNNDGGGGGQWARGKAPPPQQQHQGGRGGGGRGGRGGGRGGGQQQPFFDGPVVPLTESKNGWRPKKNTGPLVIAEKKIKSILNKMTKEKFDRLSQQIIDIPVTSYQILTLMISKVYEKGIDEPYLGDMYGDLCVRMSLHVQSNSFVQIIESNEEPPTEDGEPAPATTGGDAASNFSVFRWSHDVSTDDSDIVGPFTTVEDCMKMALSSDVQQDPVERGDIELELVKLQIKNGVFIKVLKKKKKKPDDEEKEEGEEEDDDELQDEFYTVFFPVTDHEECGQQFSKIFLSERECASDAKKQNSFKRSLLNKCEDEFNKQDIYVDLKKEKASYHESKGSMSAKEQAEKEDDLKFRNIKIKKQMLGNIKFIGQLYKKSLLKEKIMRFCIASLLNLETKNDRTKLPVYFDAGDGEMDEEDHEAICSMFTTIGQTIDKPATVGFMKVCFDKIQKLNNNNSLPARSRFMYKDLLDLRSNDWVPRRKEEKAKTLAEIRNDAEREDRQQAQESAAAQGGGNYRGHNNYGGRGGGGRGDYRSNNRNNYGNNSNRPRQQKQVMEKDDDGFTTIGGGKPMPGGSSLAQAAQKPQRILQSKSNTGNTDSKPGHPSLDKDKFERRIKTIRNEYMQDPNNLKELMLSMDELTGTKNYGSQLVSLNAEHMIDCKEAERKAIFLLLEVLVKEGKISGNDVKIGLTDTIEFIDSYVCDAPMAFDYLGRMLATMIRSSAIDVTWIGQQAEKTKLSGDAVPEKIIRATIKAIHADKGVDAVKNSFGPHQAAMETLLGKDKWVVIKAEI